MTQAQAEAVLAALGRIESALSSADFGSVVELAHKCAVGVLILAVLALVDRFLRKGALQ